MNKQNKTLMNVYKHCNNKKALIKILMLRAVTGKKFLLDNNLYVKKGDFIFNCGKTINNAKTLMNKDDEITLNLLKKINNGIIIDVGTHIGKYTIPLSKNKNVFVHSFEPNKYTYALLKENLQINDCKNVKTYNYAVSNKDDYVYFNCKEHYPEQSCISEIGEKVRSVTLDSMKFGKGKIKLIKIDVEGFDFNVLFGAITTIIRHKPKILTEIPEGINEFMLSYFFKNLGYKNIRRIENNILAE